MDIQGAILTTTIYLLAYFLLYKKNHFAGNMLFLLISASILLTQTNNLEIAMGVIGIAGSMISFIIDIIDKL